MVEDYFKTSYNIPIRSPPSSINFHDKLNDKKTSLLEEYLYEIKNDLKNAGITQIMLNNLFNSKHRNNRLEYVSESFEDLLIINPSEENILKFSKIFSLFNVSDKKFITDALILEKIIKNIKDKNFTKDLTPVLYKNPIQIYNFNIEQHFLLENKISEVFNKIYDERFRDLAISSFNTMYFGNYMDISLPSIGPLYTIFDLNKNFNSLDKHPNVNIYHFLTKIMNYDYSFMESLPILNTHFEKTISKLLLIDSTKENYYSLNFNKNMSGLNEESRLRNIIENSILGIKFNLNDVLKEGTKETSKIRNEYILPYIMKNDDKIEKLKDLGEAGDKTKIDEILRHNRTTVAKIIDLYLNNNKKFNEITRQNPQLEENMKNCLGVYVYISISIFYDVYKYYFDRLTEIMNEFIENNRFKITDVKLAFDFLEKIKRSLYNFKKILENCFYHLFLPSRLTPKYGIRINKEKGYFEVENKLLASFEHIILNYPFEFKEEELNKKSESASNKKYIINTHNSNHRFVNFALSHKSMYDIINPEEKIFIGTFIRNSKTTYEIYNTVFYKYLDSLYTQAKLNSIILKTFLKSMKTNIPIELFKEEIIELNKIKSRLSLSEYNDETKKQISILIINNFKNNYKISTNFLIQLANIKKDMLIYNKDKEFESYEYSLNSLIFYHEALVYEYMFENMIKDEDFKKKERKKMKELENYYELEILRISKEVQSEILNKKQQEINKLKSLNPKNENENGNQINNENNKKTKNSNKVLIKIKKLIEKNDILIPYQFSGKIYFISLFNNTDNLNWNQNVNTNKHLILLGESTNDILKDKSFRVLKEEEYHKIKDMSDSEKTKYIIQFIKDKDNYLDKTELSNNIIFKNFVENNCNNNGCDQILVSFNQLKKIINLK